jgi:hypothetical protein
MAGVYFQSVFQVLLLGLFFITGSLIPIFFFLFTDLIMFRTMNPFLRMDGYWLVADLFGIFNLRQQSTKLIKHYALKLFGSSGAAPPPLPNLTPRARVSLAVYSCTFDSVLLLCLRNHDSVLDLLPASGVSGTTEDRLATGPTVASQPEQTIQFAVRNSFTHGHHDFTIDLRLSTTSNRVGRGQVSGPNVVAEV